MNKIFTIMLMVILSGCASGTQLMKKINPGMNMNEVKEIMGNRDSFKTAEKGGVEYTQFTYSNRFCNANWSLREACDFTIIFKNGKVVETNTDFLEDSRERVVNQSGISTIFVNPGQ